MLLIVVMLLFYVCVRLSSCVLLCVCLMNVMLNGKFVCGLVGYVFVGIVIVDRLSRFMKFV